MFVIFISVSQREVYYILTKSVWGSWKKMCDVMSNDEKKNRRNNNSTNRRYYVDMRMEILNVIQCHPPTHISNSKFCFYIICFEWISHWHQSRCCVYKLVDKNVTYTKLAICLRRYCVFISEKSPEGIVYFKQKYFTKKNIPFDIVCKDSIQCNTMN